MEKDIEILERYLKGDILYVTELDKAIENLINRVKELEECLEAEEKYAEGLNRDIKSLLNIEPNNNFISKSKIKEKIEELKGFINDCIISEKGKFCESCKERCFFNEEIEDLKELLEEQEE